ncbi:hypothetical protein SBV1_470003 [Verrucomicrobia bacterium]|nr:hypothetical protein SBV1_470003 [Verrucomicrobiota bacterium]
MVALAGVKPGAYRMRLGLGQTQVAATAWVFRKYCLRVLARARIRELRELDVHGFATAIILDANPQVVFQ